MRKADLRLKDYLGHMQEAIERIQHYTLDLDKASFRTNALIQDAVIRNLEVLGEAAHNIETLFHDFAEQHAHIPWDDIYLMRNRISHGYFSVDHAVVWNTIQNDLPPLHTQIKTLAAQLAPAQTDNHPVKN